MANYTALRAARAAAWNLERVKSAADDLMKDALQPYIQEIDGDTDYDSYASLSIESVYMKLTTYRGRYSLHRRTGQVVRETGGGVTVSDAARSAMQRLHADICNTCNIPVMKPGASVYE